MISEAIRCQDVKAVSLGFEVIDDLRQCIGRRRFEVRIVHEHAAGVAPFCFAFNVLHKRLDRSGRLSRVADAHVPVEVMPTLVGCRLFEGVRTTGVVAIDAATREANERWHEADLLAYGRADFVNVGDEVVRVRVDVIVIMLTRVQTNLMAALPDLFHGIDVTGIAQDEPRCLDAIAVERIEYLLGMPRGPIVEGEVDDLFGGLDVVGASARLGSVAIVDALLPAGSLAAETPVLVEEEVAAMSCAGSLAGAQATKRITHASTMMTRMGMTSRKRLRGGRALEVPRGVWRCV